MANHLKGTVNQLYYCWLEYGAGSEEFSQALVQVFEEMDAKQKRDIYRTWAELRGKSYEANTWHG